MEKGYLDPMEETMTTFMTNQNQVKKVAWTKISKASQLDPLMKPRKVFQETGLSAEYFIENPTFVVNFANSVIDPFKRATSSSDEYFPSRHTDLVIEPSFFKLFSFPDLSLSSRGEKSYRITYKNITINETDSADYLKGNDQIHQFIRSNHFHPKDKTPLSIEQKQLLLLLKEMGDVIQVLLMMVWSALNPNTDYTMITCDKVVFLLCMVLNLNCSLTYKDKKKNERCLQIFEGKAYDSATATARFNKIKESITHDNAQFIATIVSLKNGGEDIYIDGYGDSHAKPLPDDFYDFVISDTTQINDALQALKVANNETPAEIDKQIEQMKSNFALNLFFRKSSKKVCILHIKSYTRDQSEHVRGELQLNFKENTMSMCQYLDSVAQKFASPFPTTNRRRLGTPTHRYATRHGGRSKKRRATRRKRRIHGGSNSRKRKNSSRDRNNSSRDRNDSSRDRQPSYDHLKFPSGAFYQDGENVEEWYAKLVDEVKQNMKEEYEVYFVHIYSQLLYMFYLENEVASGDVLQQKMKEIENELETTFAQVSTEMEVEYEPPDSQPPSSQDPGFGSMAYSFVPKNNFFKF